MNNQKLIKELHKLADKNRGVLLPERIVNAAKPATSPLHKYFTWDDTEAGELYRLHQARQLISTVVRYVGTDKDRRPVRVFVSLTQDRNKGGGYRDIVTVLSNTGMRKQLLQDAAMELQRFEQKYSHLKELSDVFNASKTFQKELKAAWSAE